MNVRHLPPRPMRAPAPPQARPSFDASGPAPHTAALKAAWHDGFLYGEREAYVSGWRVGICTGALLMLLLGIGAVVAAKAQGWL